MDDASEMTLEQGREKLDSMVTKHFGYLVTEYGFVFTRKKYAPETMGNFIVELKKDNILLSIVRDRSQIFIDFHTPTMKQRSKEKILEELGIPFDRYPIKDGLWQGYEIQNQSADLKKYLPMILDHIKQAE